jgi:hypothetical protein
MTNAETEEIQAVIKPVKEMMTSHAISTDKHGNLIKGNTTCACWNCFNSADGFHGVFAFGWDSVDLLKQTEHPVHDTHIEVGDNNAAPVQNDEITCSKGNYVLAAYDRSFYIGTVLEDDVSDHTLHMDLMVESGKVVDKFRWPKNQDTLWINCKYIIFKIQHPIATGKGGFVFLIMSLNL